MTPVVWPVIHTLFGQQVVRCAELARSCGSEGVFLISMHGDDNFVDRAAGAVRTFCPSLKIGVNYLTMSPADALLRSMNHGYAGTWFDRPDFDSGRVGNDALDASALLRVHGLKGHRVFVGVAFKGQPYEPHQALAARRAIELGFVPTTSGDGTGIAPPPQKLADMRARLHPLDQLAIASGVTPENAQSFAPFVTDILVSTGISKTFHEFDEDKLRRLMAALQQTGGDK